MVAFWVALGLALLITPLGQWLGEKWGLVAVPGGRRQHHGTISRLGGIGIAAGFFGALAVSRWHPIPSADPNEMRRFWGVVLGGGLMFALGLLDDRYELPPWAQYAGYLAAAGIAIASLIILERFNNPFTGTMIILPALLYVPLTMFWITGMIVTVNWLDGLDGLAAGVAAILAATLSFHMHRVGQESVVPQAAALLGASLGFLMYNVHPARVFMGSNGSFLLGYLIAALGLVAGGRVATVLLVMGIPIVDVAWTILDRWQRGSSPTQSDRAHLHFRLQDAGLSTRAIVLLYWGFCALAGFLALTLPSHFYKLVTLVLLAGLTGGVLWYLKRRT